MDVCLRICLIRRLSHDAVSCQRMVRGGEEGELAGMWEGEGLSRGARNLSEYGRDLGRRRGRRMPPSAAQGWPRHEERGVCRVEGLACMREGGVPRVVGSDKRMTEV
jgi:hypothetical protein